MLDFLNRNIFIIIFFIFVFAALLIDLIVVNSKKSRFTTIKESLFLTLFWVIVALIFYLIIHFFGEQIHQIKNIEELNLFIQLYSPHIHIKTDDFSEALKIYRETIAIDFLTGYFLEYTLSLDNIFVMLVLLKSFSVASNNFKTVLFWGLFGAVVLRFVFIFAGSALIIKFTWLFYFFGAILVFSALKIITQPLKSETHEINNHWLVKFLSKHLNVYPSYINGYFIKHIDGKLFVTPLFIVVIMIEFTDVIFAFDSIPAIFSITRDPYIVFFSNILAIIGLRSLFFILSNIIDYFRYLRVGVSILLFLIGLKLIFNEYLEAIDYKNLYFLIKILIILITSIVLSIIIPVKQHELKRDR